MGFIISDKRCRMIYNNVLEAVGHTPMVRLNRLVKPGSAEVLVKFASRKVHGFYRYYISVILYNQSSKKGAIKLQKGIDSPTHLTRSNSSM